MQFRNAVTAWLATAAAIAPLRAAPAPDAALVESALIAELHTSDEVAIRQRFAASRDHVAEQMRKDPNELMGGVIVFATGLDSKQLAELAGSNAIEIARAEAKVAVLGGTITETMSFGAMNLLVLDGTLDERLEKLVGHWRAELAADAANSDGAEAAAHREAAYSREIRFYKIEAVGPASSFARMQDRADLAAVLVDGSNKRVTDFAASRAVVQRMSPRLVVKGRPYADGPPPGMQINGGPTLFGGAPTAPPDPVIERLERSAPGAPPPGN
jgi:hypothetical protein